MFFRDLWSFFKKTISHHFFLPCHYSKTINPADESEICEVAFGGREDVDVAVAAAKAAFSPGAKWREMNARDRGALLFRLADLMEEHQEELATLESIDSGAVYTLALKTHIGMSIATFRWGVARFFCAHVGNE